MKIYSGCVIFILLIYVLLYYLIIETTPNLVALATNIWNENVVTEFYLLSGFLPVKVYKDLTSPDKFKIELHRVGGVYGLVNISDPNKIKQYIGSSKDLYQRISDHLKGRDSNSRLLPTGEVF